MLKLTESLAPKAHSYHPLISKTQGYLHTFLPPVEAASPQKRQYKLLVNRVGLSCTAWGHAATLQWCDLGQETGLHLSNGTIQSTYLTAVLGARKEYMGSQILGTKPGIYCSVSTHLHLIIAKAQLGLLGWTHVKWQHWTSHPRQTPCHPEQDSTLGGRGVQS